MRGQNVSTCIVRGLHQRAVIRTESFSRRVKENWDKYRGAEKILLTPMG